MVPSNDNPCFMAGKLITIIRSVVLGLTWIWVNGYSEKGCTYYTSCIVLGRVKPKNDLEIKFVKYASQPCWWLVYDNSVGYKIDQRKEGINLANEKS